MQYIISDIHGCYDQYKQLLQKINFSDSDTLYILGDAVDRGPEPIKVLQDIMMRPNVVYILGNHDFMMLVSLRKLTREITEESCEEVTTDDLMSYYYWTQDGGEVTARQFKKLSKDEQLDIIDFLEECLTYEIVAHKKKIYILVHAGIANFDEDKDLDEYEFWDFIDGRTDYEKRYYKNENIYVVTGHTPTQLIREDRKPLVFEGNGHIAIDCGCVFGGQLAAYCVETGNVIYVEGERCGKNRFEHKFVEVPNPFEVGDIVRVVGDSERFGIVETSQEEWKKYLQRVKETKLTDSWLDAAITCCFFNEELEAFHDHVSPIFLEKVEVEEIDEEEKRELLQAGSELMKGKGMLSYFLYLYGKR